MQIKNKGKIKMKKFFCLILCIIFAFSLSACDKSAGKKSDHSVDVVYYAKLGQLNDLDYRLGDDIESTKTKLSETADDHGGSNYFDYTSGDYTVMTDGTVYCSYKTDDSAAGITHIAKSDDVYGFAIGTISTQVRETMSTMGYDATEREATRDEIFFLPAAADMTVLEYQIKENKVLFIFQEHALGTTLITKK